MLKLVLLVAVASCVGVDESGLVREERREDPTCPEGGCGLNSPTVGDGILFEEQERTGTLRNRGGVRIESAWLDATPVTLEVVRDRLYAHEVWGTRTYRDFELLGLIITFDAAADPETGRPAERFQLQLVEFTEKAVTFWAGADEPVPYYHFKARRWIDDPEHDTDPFTIEICKRNPLDATKWWTGTRYGAFLFQGDRYDPFAKKVTEVSPSDPWFNIACGGSAVAKLHLLRLTRAGSYNAAGVVAYDSTVLQRQAMLKAFTADYCGNGVVFTVDGQRLLYKDALARRDVDMTPGATVASWEAIWTPQGAKCLSTPRREPWGITPAVVNAACPAPILPCTSADVASWYTDGFVITANPL